jgi:hypothetical protein
MRHTATWCLGIVSCCDYHKKKLGLHGENLIPKATKERNERDHQEWLATWKNKEIVK